MAYAAAISLKFTLQGLRYSDNFSITDSVSMIIHTTIGEIESLQQVLEILDEGYGDSRTEFKLWELVESQMLKHFSSQYPIVQFGFKESLEEFLWRTRVDASEVEQLREISGVNKLEEVLRQWLLSSKLFPVELDRVKQEIYSFTQTVEMIYEDNQNKSSNTVQLWHAFPETRDLIREIKKYAGEVLRIFKTTVKRFDKIRSISSRERVNAFDIQIREAVYEFEDFLDTHVLDRFVNSQSEGLVRILPFPLDSHEVETYVLPFTQLVKKLTQEYMIELVDPLLQENKNDDDDIVVSRESFSCENKCKMVGFNDKVVTLKEHLTDSFSKLKVCTLYGMAGIGKMMVASKVFEDPSMLDWFELRVWVDVGQNYQFKRIMQSIIAQLNPSYKIDELLTTGDESLEGYLLKSLNGRRYLILLDDVWDRSVWDDMRRFFPDNSNGSRVLLTTRLQKSRKIWVHV